MKTVGNCFITSKAEQISFYSFVYSHLCTHLRKCHAKRFCTRIKCRKLISFTRVNFTSGNDIVCFSISVDLIQSRCKITVKALEHLRKGYVIYGNKKLWNIHPFYFPLSDAVIPFAEGQPALSYDVARQWKR